MLEGNLHREKNKPDRWLRTRCRKDGSYSASCGKTVPTDFRLHSPPKTWVYFCSKLQSTLPFPSSHAMKVGGKKGEPVGGRMWIEPDTASKQSTCTLQACRGFFTLPCAYFPNTKPFVADNLNPQVPTLRGAWKNWGMLWQLLCGGSKFPAEILGLAKSVKVLLKELGYAVTTTLRWFEISC